MLKNYVKIAWRNIWKNRVFSVINIAGLSIGISAALVIYTMVTYEFSFDTFHKEGHRIYRIVTNSSFAEKVFPNSGVPAPLAKAVSKEITGIEEVAEFHLYGGKVSLPAKPQVVFKEQSDIVFADKHYFGLFNYQWLAGSPEASLNEPYKVVLTQSRAEKYFPDARREEVLGKSIIYNDSVRVTVSGIVEDIRKNTDFTFKEFISLPTVYTSGLRYNFGIGSWNSINSSSQLFVRLSGKTPPGEIEARFPALLRKYSKDYDPDETEHRLQPLADIHFNADYSAFYHRQAHKPTLYGLLMIAVFLLVLGGINFINLSTAQAGRRAREIGIRKTAGSTKKQLVFLFLGETFLLTFLASILSLLMLPALLDIFSDFLPGGLSMQSVPTARVIIFLLILLALLSFLSGFYPAFMLARFEPVRILKDSTGRHTGKTRTSRLRQSLTIIQFVIAQIFILATVIAGQQIRYSLNKDMGFRKEAIVTFSVPYFWENEHSRNVLYDKLRAIPQIEKISLAGSPPASGSTSSRSLKFIRNGTELETHVDVKYADTSYLSLYELELLAGRNLHQSDTVKEFIINETYARQLGFKEPAEAIGRFIRGERLIPVVGVVADFNLKSTRSPINPAVITSDAQSHYTFHLALGNSLPGTWKNVLAKVEAAWNEVYSGEPFEYSFFDQRIAAFYEREQKLSRLLAWTAGITIFISCLGLLGLTLHTTGQRTKEIGIRKVLGASVSGLVGMLSKDLLKLVVIAILIASPVAWYLMGRWLDSFAYRISLQWWMFALGGSLAFLVALLTMGFQSVKAALANPVDSLRTE